MRGSAHVKLLRGNIKGRGIHVKNWPNRILAKSKTMTYTSKVGMRDLIRYQWCSDIEVGVLHLADVAGFLLMLGSTITDTEGKRQGST